MQYITINSVSDHRMRLEAHTQYIQTLLRDSSKNWEECLPALSVIAYSDSVRMAKTEIDRWFSQVNQLRLRIINVLNGVGQLGFVEEIEELAAMVDKRKMNDLILAVSDERGSLKSKFLQVRDQSKNELTASRDRCDEMIIKEIEHFTSDSPEAAPSDDMNVFKYFSDSFEGSYRILLDGR